MSRNKWIRLFLYAVCMAYLFVLYLLKSENNTAASVHAQVETTGPRKIDYGGNILLLYWSKIFHGYKPTLLYSSEECPIRCEVTSNRSRVREASAFLVHATNTDEMPPERYSDVPWVIHSNENPNNAPALKDSRIVSKFTYYMGYRVDSDIPVTAFPKPSLDKPVSFNKKKLLVAMYSNCEPTRTEYLRRLMKHIPLDSYGKCFRNKFGYPDRDSYNFSDVALEIQRSYKFTLTFTNGDCDYYFTEKIWNALSAGSVPVWLGTDKIDEVLWGNLKDSVIKVSDYPSPSKLAKYLTFLSQNEAEYNKFLKWKYEGFDFPREYYSSRIARCWEARFPSFCRACLRIARDRWPHRGLTSDKCDGTQRRTLEKWIRE